MLCPFYTEKNLKFKVQKVCEDSKGKFFFYTKFYPIPPITDIQFSNGNRHVHASNLINDCS